MLNIAVSSKLILNMSEPCRIFDSADKDAFEKHMAANLEKPLPMGPLFSFLKAMQGTGLVNIFVVSKIGPESGKRITRSLEMHGLPIPNDRLIYKDDYKAYAEAKNLNVHAYFSCNQQDVKDALDQGIPAAYLVPIDYSRKPIEKEIVIATDFDGVIASDESDIFFSQAEAEANKLGMSKDALLKQVRAYEKANQHNILPSGPFMPFIKAISDIRKKLQEKPEGIQIKLHVVTARCEDCGHRAKNTLKDFGIEIDHIELRDGAPKGAYVQSIGAHFYIDDSPKHVANVSSLGIITGHIPKGVSNKDFVATKNTLYFNPRSPSPSPKWQAARGEPPMPEPSPLPSLKLE